LGVTPADPLDGASASTHRLVCRFPGVQRDEGVGAAIYLPGRHCRVVLPLCVAVSNGVARVLFLL